MSEFESQPGEDQGAEIPWRFDTERQWAEQAFENTEKSEHFIGRGSECVVVEANGESQNVVAFEYGDLDSSEMKGIFYAQRVFSTLFPHNFPHFSLAFSNKDKEGFAPEESEPIYLISGTVRQRVEGRILTADEQDREFDRTFLSQNAAEIKYPFREVTAFLKDTGIGTSILDHWGRNLIVGADGGQYYIDKIDPSWHKQWNLAKIYEYMNDNGYSNKEKKIVRSSLKRLKELDAIVEKED